MITKEQIKSEIKILESEIKRRTDSLKQFENQEYEEKLEQIRLLFKSFTWTLEVWGVKADSLYLCIIDANSVNKLDTLATYFSTAGIDGYNLSRSFIGGSWSIYFKSYNDLTGFCDHFSVNYNTNIDLSRINKQILEETNRLKILQKYVENIQSAYNF